jgi:hypothetical protein
MICRGGRTPVRRSGLDDLLESLEAATGLLNVGLAEKEKVCRLTLSTV